MKDLASNLINSYIAKSVAEGSLDTAKAFADFKSDFLGLHKDKEELESNPEVVGAKTSKDKSTFVPLGKNHVESVEALLSTLGLNSEDFCKELADRIKDKHIPGSSFHSRVVIKYPTRMCPAINLYSVGSPPVAGSYSIIRMLYEWTKKNPTLSGLIINPDPIGGFLIEVQKTEA